MTWTEKDAERHKLEARRERDLLQRLGAPADERKIVLWIAELRKAHREMDEIGSVLAGSTIPMEHGVERELLQRQSAVQTRIRQLETALGIRVPGATEGHKIRASTRDRTGSPRHYRRREKR